MIKIWLTALTILLPWSLPASFAADPHDHGSGGTDTQLTLDHGQKWKGDQPLRQSMTNIQTLMKTNLTAIHDNKLSPEKYRELGLGIKKETDHIFKNCKLAPKADQMLHLILVKILKAQSAFSSQDSTVSTHDAAVLVLTALDEYGKYFDHPGWK